MNEKEWYNLPCLHLFSLFCYSLKRASIEEKGIVRVNSLSEIKNINNQENIKIRTQLDLLTGKRDR